MVLLQHDPASISYDTATLWPPVTSPSVTAGPGPGSILPGAASLLEVLLALSWAPPHLPQAVLGSWSSCPAGQQHPQPPPAPQLWSSLPCSLWEGLQFRLPGCVKTFQNQCLTSPLSFVNEIRPEEWLLDGVYPSPASLPHSIEPMHWAFHTIYRKWKTSDNISFKTILKNTGRKYTNMIFLWINGFIHEFYFLLHAFLYFPNFLQCLYYVLMIL